MDIKKPPTSVSITGLLLSNKTHNQVVDMLERASQLNTEKGANMIKNDGHHPTAPDSKHGRWHYTAPLTREAANTILLRLASDNEETVIPDGKGHYLDNKCFRVYTEHGGNLFAVHNFNGRYSIISIDAIEATNLGIWNLE